MLSPLVQQRCNVELLVDRLAGSLGMAVLISSKYEKKARQSKARQANHAKAGKQSKGTHRWKESKDELVRSAVPKCGPSMSQES
jgi:hypothetical protein